MRTKRSSLRTPAMTDRRQLVLPSKCCTYVDSITSPVDENNHHARRSPRQISTGGKDGRYVFFLHDFSINVLDTMNGRCIELQSSTAKIFNFVPTDDLAFGYCIFSRGQLLHLSSAAYVGLSDVLLNGIVDDDFSHSLNLLPDGRVLTVVGGGHVRLRRSRRRKPLYHGVFESGHFFDGSFFYFRAADPNAPLDAVVTKLQHVVRNDLKGGDEVLKTRPPIAPDPHFTARFVAGKTTWSYSGCWHRNLFYACLSAEGHEGYVNLFQVFDLNTLEWRRMTIDGLTFTQQRPFFHTDSSGDFLLVHLPHGDRPPPTPSTAIGFR
ncbi:hypothetical protein M3Y99_01889400 [Aphelenchoides fujianensis]|nr:hypothetical protein M3Y99_01889400 [Aphelenchoides fujianensis]